MQQSENFAQLEFAVQRLITDIAHNRTNFAQIVSSQGQSLRDHVTTELRQLQLDIHESNHHDNVLNPLAFPQVYARQESVTEAHQGTFQWLFQQSSRHADLLWDPFVPWLESNRGIYWVSGAAGCGKSTLMKTIWERRRILVEKKLAGVAGLAQIQTACFFFWRQADASMLQKSIIGMLRSLLYQVLESCP